MINFDDVAKENMNEHNPSWPQLPDLNNQRLQIQKKNYYLI